MIGVMVSLSLLCQGVPTARAEAPSDFIVDGMTQVERAQLIDDFFASKGDLPLSGYGIVFVKAADEFSVDWRLVASIGFNESTGGKFACGYNAFGWKGCDRKTFSSYEEAITTITRHLGGHDEKTDQYYKGKTVEQIVNMYNPPSANPKYLRHVLSTMDKIYTKEDVKLARS